MGIRKPIERDYRDGMDGWKGGACILSRSPCNAKGQGPPSGRGKGKRHARPLPACHACHGCESARVGRSGLFGHDGP